MTTLETEQAAWLERMVDLAQRPKLYGEPWDVSATAAALFALHGAHVPGSVEASMAWVAISRRALAGRSLVEVLGAARLDAFRYYHCGSSILTARRQVVMTFRSAWRKIPHDGRRPRTEEAVRRLLGSDLLFPDDPVSLEVVLRGLFTILVRGTGITVQSLIARDLDRLGGGATRRLCDVGSRSELLRRSPSFNWDASDYKAVCSVVMAAIVDIDN